MDVVRCDHCICFCSDPIALVCCSRQMGWFRPQHYSVAEVHTSDALRIEHSMYHRIPILLGLVVRVCLFVGWLVGLFACLFVCFLGKGRGAYLFYVGCCDICGNSTTSWVSAFPAISLGFTILVEIFAYVTGFNPTREIVTFPLRGWC